METRENILSRRSIRNYLPTPVSKEDLQEILEAGTWAPSAAKAMKALIDSGATAS